MTKPSIRSRLLEFYEANPDEELTYAAIEAKYGAKYVTIRGALKKMRAKGEIECVYVIRRPEAGRAAR